MSYENLLAAKDQTIKMLYIGWAIPVALALIMGIGWAMAPKDIRLHLPPDLSAGTTMQVGEIPKPNIYTFTFYIFQQLNRWTVNGEKDYQDKIYMLSAYFTPACFQNRLDDYESKKLRRELAGRERSVMEIPGRRYSPGRVKKTSNSSWIVSFDLHVRENFRGETIKNRFINYQLKVVKHAVDPEANPWGLAIDCYASAPRVIKMQEVQGG